MFFKVHYILPMREAESERILKYVYKQPTLVSIMYRTTTDRERKLAQHYKLTIPIQNLPLNSNKKILLKINVKHFP